MLQQKIRAIFTKLSNKKLWKPEYLTDRAGPGIKNKTNMIQKRSIYGRESIIHGSIQLTNIRTGKKKFFLVCEIADTKENRNAFSKESFGVKYITLTSDYGITQKSASLMDQIPSDNLVAYKGYKF